MSLSFRDFLRESIDQIEQRCIAIYHCGGYFSTAYRCRTYLREYGYYDAVTVRIVPGAYLPMSSDYYREWRLLNRQLDALNAE